MEPTFIEADSPQRTRHLSSMRQRAATDHMGPDAMRAASRFQRSVSPSITVPGSVRPTPRASRAAPAGRASVMILPPTVHSVPGTRATHSPTIDSTSAAEWTSSAFTMAIPKDASRLLLHPLDAQRQQQLAFAMSYNEQQLEELDKQGRLEMLRQQQARRVSWAQASAAAVADMLAVWECVSLAVRDRLTSLQPEGYQTFAFPDGTAVYEGHWKNCYPHGKGCLRRSQPMNDVYEGQWFVGQRCGTGTYHSGDFSLLYQGSWLDDKLHGKGELVEPEGVYSGEFVENTLHGYGEYVYNDGHVYKGDWVCGLYEGSGTYLYPSGTKYEGGWLRGCEHGRGTKWFSNGDVYIGEWMHGMPHGNGSLSSSCSTAARVSGQWRYGSLHGQATCVFADGSHYVGEWRRGRFHGHGTYEVPRSTGEVRRYTGAYENGKRHGYGEYTSATVSYAGEWVRDKKHGEGSLQMRGGGTYHGRWKEDAPDGEGTYVSAYRRGYHDEMHCDARDGTFTSCVDETTQQRIDVRLLGR
ncbi:MORN repeat [Novymonas esmeraldas]|uniref:MORN repeat n=1 Tax=Novymonas esmeraldas TaxID=1808958 RepID=A0AAW0EZ01_9TRYP